jgi:hypothetical protein
MVVIGCLTTARALHSAMVIVEKEHSNNTILLLMLMNEKQMMIQTRSKVMTTPIISGLSYHIGANISFFYGKLLLTWVCNCILYLDFDKSIKFMNGIKSL